MANKFHNKMRRGMGPRPGMAGKMPGMKVKPGFNTGSFGKSQRRDRSGGTKKAKIYANSEGL